MATVISFHQFRPDAAPNAKSGRKRVFFDRSELYRLLNLYSRRVMSGEWRDYAIDHDDRSATFSVFRHAAERPMYAITKIHGTGGKSGNRYVLTAGPEKLSASADLADVIEALEKRLRLVWTGS
ncbi:MAG: DUF2794 domain-containing protein [Alphaproteobacteria bacterium]